MRGSMFSSPRIAFIVTLVRRGRSQYARASRKRGQRLIFDGAFADHFARFLVLTQCYELCVAQVVVGCPFEEFKAPYKEGPEPDAVFHLLGGETINDAGKPR
jgi:hypothetical protein